MYANSINIAQTNQSILQNSEIYIDKANLKFLEIKEHADFLKNDTEHINLGFVKDEVVWVKFVLENTTDEKISKILVVYNPLLEEVVLYCDNKKETRGMLHVSKLQHNIQPFFEIHLDAKSKKIYYLQVKNETTALRFGLFLKDKELFLHEDHMQQTLIMIFIGIIIALFLYNLLLYLYTKDKSYLFYGLYLGALVFQQITYLGISPLFFSADFIYIDNLIVLLKVNTMYIMAALFARSFLNTANYPSIDKFYKYIIIIAIIEIPIFGTQLFYYPEVGILTGLLFVIFNIYAGVRIYLDGYKQARFFIAGWSVLVVGFILMILDGLGLISVMQDFPNLIMYSTALEALVLSLAFTDRYILLSKEKDRMDAALVHELEQRQVLIQREIDIQTKDLYNALESKKVLLKELHHRIKNNLQLILSIIRIQANNCKQEKIKEKFEELDGRIRAISRTHELLYIKDNLEYIDMNEYINELCEDMEVGFGNSRNFTIDIKIADIHIPLREASYIGLIVNELVTNSIKHNKHKDKNIIKISLVKNANIYLLNIGDNGQGFDEASLDKNTLGLTLVKTLVELQLEGTLGIANGSGLDYKIEFTL